MTIWAVFLVAALVAFLLWLLLRRLLREEREMQRRQPYRRQSLLDLYDEFEEEERRQAEAAVRAKRQRSIGRTIEQVQALSDADPRLIELIADQLEVSVIEVHWLLSDQDEVRRLVARLDHNFVTIVVTAGQPLEEFSAIELKRTTVIEPVDYPTNLMEPATITDYTQLPGVLAEEQALPDELFYLGVATESLRIVQAFDHQDERRRLYILMDVSGSMGYAMPDGQRRQAWALGITLHLLLRATRGEASYHLRSFNDRPKERYSASTPAEAEELIQRIIKMGSSHGATDIMRALRQAVTDIRSENETNIASSDILLITDGEDNHIKSDELRRLFGDDIRLHTALIGVQSSKLKQIATTYHVYR
jgi:hypothetical protein